MITIVMPSFSAGMEAARVARWVCRVGEAVAAGDVIAEVETDKATMEIEAPQDGALTQILAPEGRQPHAVGAALALFAPGAGPEAATPTVDEGPLAPVAFRDALRDALAEEMRRDASIVLVGASASGGGASRLGRGLAAEFEARRLIDVAAASQVVAGVALGLALGGARPVVEFARGADVGAAAAAIAASAALGLPILWRAPLGAEAIAAPAVEGLAILAPGGAADAKRLTKGALRAAGPTLLLEAEALLAAIEPAPVGGDGAEAAGAARLVAPGADVTIASHSSGLAAAAEVLNQIQTEGRSAALIDLRSLAPMDAARLAESARATGCCLVIDPPGAPAVGGAIALALAAAGCAARVVAIVSTEPAAILAALRAMLVRRLS